MALKTVRIAAALLSGRRASEPLSGAVSFWGVLPGKGAEGVGVVVAVGVAVGVADAVGVGAAEALADVSAGDGTVAPAFGSSCFESAAFAVASDDGAGATAAEVSLGAGAGSVTAGSLVPGVGAEGSSGPHEGPILGTGGGVS